MKHIIITSLSLLALFSVAAQSQELDASELEHKLKLRDKAIIELLERVESLEKGFGLSRPAKNTTKPSENKTEKATEKNNRVAPGSVVVEEGAEERALERALTLEGALLLPSGVMELEPGLSFIRREDSAPGFEIVGTDTFPSNIELNANIVTASLALRLGLPWESQLELGFPYRQVNSESVTSINFATVSETKESNTEYGDLSIGWAKTLFRESNSSPDLVGRLTWDTDSGDGDGFDELRGSLTAIKRHDPVTLIGGLSYQHTFESRQTQPGAAIGLNVGSLIALSPETSMRFIVSTLFQSETKISGTKVVGSDRTIASFIIGGSIVMKPGTLLNLSVGIGLTKDADDFSISLSLPFRI